MTAGWSGGGAWSWLTDDVAHPRWLLILAWAGVTLSAFSGLLRLVEALS